MSSLSKRTLAAIALLLSGLSACGNEGSEVRPTGAPDRTGSADEDGVSSLPGELSFEFGEELSAKLALVDATQDEWESEVIEGELKVWLSAIGDVIAHGDHGEARLAVEALACAPMRPALELAHEGLAVRVWRAAPPAGAVDLHRGEAGLREALSKLSEPLRRGGAEVHVKLKVVHVEPREGGAEATLLYQTYGDGATQQSATWKASFVREEGELRLASMEVSEFEEVQRVGNEPLFADCTEAILGNERAFREEFVPGLNVWRKSLDSRLGVTLFGHQGIAVGDVNGDGLDDLFACQVGGLPTRLFVQQPDGTAKDVSRRAGVDFLNNVHSALFADFDGDGDQDLVVAMEGVVFLENDGEGNFKVSALLADVGGLTSMAAADYDLDGDLDLYLCSYDIPDKSAPIPYHDANNGPPNMLVENEGDWAFKDATRSAHLKHKNRRYSFACSWEDYDNDGDPDLYVANDFGRNNLYRNDGGVFVDVAAEAGVEDISAGMAITWGDYDGDGWMDIYVSNMWSSAGNRVTYQRNFRPGETAETRAEFQRHARGNSLFRNRGDGTFEDVSAEARISMGRWAWCSAFLDIDNDGNEDLLVANGFLTNEVAEDL